MTIIKKIEYVGIDVVTGAPVRGYCGSLKQ